ncbi:T9SS type B sorting domain-containing protein [Hyunsoonleella sp. 2307UL5-6]|uniref:T9SS type B sorting domain-containing protein n=1 Tax=Hyunsoonleella sp. 2307UL5-6 TaxID=3384768 RepID=UPI0039BCE945
MKSVKTVTSILLTLISYSLLLAQSPTDCIDAVIACGNSEINLDVNGPGQQELSESNSCFGRENNSVWLKVTTITNGSLGFTLKPASTNINEDYDFFVFGPNVSCGNIGTAIRCSTTNPVQAGLSSNFTGMNSTSVDTSEGPGADGDSFVSTIDALVGETYFIVIDRPIGESAFTLEWTGSAEFSDPPVNNADTSGDSIDLESCDITAPFNDGLTTFDLESNTTKILGTQTNVTVTYHTSESDANIGTNQLSSPYINTSNPETIYARITNNTTGCFEFTQFNLSATLGPNFTEPSNYIICDDLSDGDDANGRAIFTLSSRTNEILNGQNPSDIRVTYHSTALGAELNTSSTVLPDNYYNNSPFNEDIFVRIEDVMNPDCVSTATLTLIVNPAPERIDSNILQCDEDGVFDDITIFNLNEANAALTNGVANLSTTFYTDAARINEIPNPENYNNTSNPQTIYVSVINDDTSCSTEAELTLNISTTDVVNTSIIRCDDDGIEDGFFTFNLNDASANIISNLSLNLDVVYYENYEDALREQNILNITYTNTQPEQQTIYARVENNNNCFGISAVNLMVILPPQIEKETLEYYCTNFFPETISIDAGPIDGNENEFTYSWSTGASTYSIDINNAGTYSVRITNITSSCFADRVITVDPSNEATIRSIEVIDTSQNNTITVNASGEGLYQYSILNNDTELRTPFQDSNIFQNVKPGIYTVFVTDIENNCGTIDDAVSVIGFPKFFTPNNDGQNDTWQIFGVSEMFQPNTKIMIFNRYGKLLKEISPLGKGWDGILNGQVLPADDYWFYIKLQNGKIFKDHFTLKI